MPFYLGNAHGWGNGMMDWSGAFFWPGIMIPLAIWSAVAMGFALWHAAKRNEKWWFIFFLFIHTAGIFELLYLLFVVGIFNAPEKPDHKTRVITKRGKK